MSISKDRVIFSIPENCLLRSSSVKLRDLLCQVFSIAPNEIPASGDFTITCRPSQFARFLILRNDAGLQNGFKELRPRLFTPKPALSRIDVSKRPNEYRAKAVDVEEREGEAE